MKDHLFKKICFIATYCFLLALIVVRFNSIYDFYLRGLSILSPFFIGLAIAFILNKPMLTFRRLLSRVIKKSSTVNGLSIFISYILFFVTVTAVFTFIVPQLLVSISTFFTNIGVYIKNLESFMLRVTEEFNITPTMYTQLFDYFGTLMQDVATFALSTLKNLVPQIANITSSLVSIVFNGIIALVVSINLLASKEKLLSQGKQITYTYIPLKWATRIEHIFRLSADIFSKYVVGQLVEACIIGGLCFVGMEIFGFEYSLLISTLIAVTALIPVMGAYIGGGVAFVLLAILNPVRALLFLIYLCVLQQLEGSIIYPRVVGSSIGLPGLWVIFAVTVGGGLLGLPGILLGVPIMSIIYTLIKQDVTNKKAAVSS
ncbi:MAG: AI-2E family transporter [Cellulosilyticaceae bacterium]